MTETPLPEEWLLTIAAIPYWTIALALLIAVVIFAIFNVQAGQPSSNPSNIQKRFGLITWSRRGHIFHPWAMGMCTCNVDGGIFGNIISVDPRNLGHIKSGYNPRQLAIALPAVAAASAGLIALPDDTRFRGTIPTASTPP